MKRLREWWPAALLFAISAAICRRLFFTDYVNNLGSVDGSYVAMARHTMLYWRDLAWWPIWFGGMAMQNVYGPLLHMATALLAIVARQSPAWALHTLTAFFYCLGPVALWWAVLRISGARIWALATGLIFALTSPVAWLLPSIRSDIGGFLHLRRLYSMVRYGEYPHVAVLALIPVALVIFERMIRDKRLHWIAAGAVIIAAIACASVTGTAGFAMVTLAWLFALPAADWPRALARLGAAALLAYGLAMPWLPPSTVRLVWLNSQWGTGRPTPFTALHLFYFGLIAVAAAGLRLAMARRGAPPLLRLAVLVIFFSGIVMAADLGTGTALVPQPYRFQLEFEMGCCLAGGFLWAKIAGRLPRRIHLALAGVLVTMLTAVNAVHAGRYIQPIDIHGTVEYQSAMWFDRNMSGTRVFAPGSVSFWMNAFTDTPQLGGCCDQGIPSWAERVALYSVYTGQNMGAREGTVSLLWLQAFGVRAVEVSRPGSREFYKPFSKPRKFDGLLPILWQGGGDVIYRVPQRSTSLAHVMRPSDIVSIDERPKDGLDIAALEKYVAALNNPQVPLAEMHWLGQSCARIAAAASPADVISVQVSYDRGWQARSGGREIPLTSDGLGLIVVHPNCAGECTIDLEYDGGREMGIARIIRIVALLLCGALAIAGRPRTTYK